jgi:hypothetical protein
MISAATLPPYALAVSESSVMASRVKYHQPFGACVLASKVLTNAVVHARCQL